ncbi:MAG: ATPase [Planctomycetaceae bacterium]
MSEPVVLCFSGGKDCSLAHWEVSQGSEFHVGVLLSTVTPAYDRISMHGVRRSLLRMQAEALGLPLMEVEISPGASNVEYEAAMETKLNELSRQGFRTIVFGDIFLEDLREYRENQMAQLGWQCLFPIWKRDSHELAETFLQLGFRAKTACVDPRKLDRTFVGADYSREFLDRLPPGIDPCGENGEFHTFVYDSPLFREPIAIETGQVVERDGFLFCDLVSSEATAMPLNG